jgi:hypothetical protein
MTTWSVDTDAARLVEMSAPGAPFTEAAAAAMLDTRGYPPPSGPVAQANRINDSPRLLNDRGNDRLAKERDIDRIVNDNGRLVNDNARLINTNDHLTDQMDGQLTRHGSLASIANCRAS